jgi:phosphoglycolate phosphatase
VPKRSASLSTSAALVVIGDTPKDVGAAKGLAAKGLRAECVGVGTGGCTPEKLVELGATHAFATLDENGVVDVLLKR